MTNIDESLGKFASFLKDVDQFIENDMSETDTRSKVIDKLFFDVLGWDESDVIREEHVDSGYYDYKFSTSDFGFVVEAKKNFVEFSLPDRGRFVSFNTLLKGNKEVIEQIRDYIVDKSLSFGIITNGKQFIFGQFINTGGHDWKKNKAVIFRNLDDIAENFIEFHNYLSREAVVQNRQIRINLPAPVPNVMLDHLKGNSESIFRNEFSSQITDVILKAFGEIGRDKDSAEIELLKYCYIKNKDINKYATELDSTFSDIPPKFEAKIEKIKVGDSLTDKMKEKLVTENYVKTPSPLMILIGGKGVGKSTFIKYFFEIELSSKLKTQRPSVYLDFRGYTEQGVKDTKSICQKYIDKLSKSYPELNLFDINVLKQIYKTRIEENSKGIWRHLTDQKENYDGKVANFLEERMSDPVNHLEMVSKYLQGHCNKNLCLIFDNVDQLGDDAQKEAFLLAESIHQRLNCITIISLREGYYNSWKNKPPFNAFHSTVFHISAPRYSEVIKKRLEYITEKLSFEKITGDVRGKSVTLSPTGFKNLFSSLHHTLFKYQNSDLLSYLEETSYPDIRLGLEKIKKFLVSGHTNISSYMTYSSYRIPIWEFIKAIAFDNSRYYHSDESLIFNILNPVNGNSNHFTKIRILEFLYYESGQKVNVEKYYLVKEIIDIFKTAGYDDSIIISELTELLNWLLIDDIAISSDIDHDGKISMISKVRLTYSGMYYLTQLLNRFHYSELVMQDTPIFNEDYFNKLKSNFPESDIYGKRNLSSSLESVSYFLEYLSEEETRDHERALVENLHPCLKLNIYSERILTKKMQADIDHIKSILKK